MILLRLFFLLFSVSAVSNALALNLSNLYEAQLPRPASVAERTLGTAIATSGTTAAVAAFSSDKTVAGAVYLYDTQADWRLNFEIKSEFNKDDFAKRIILVDGLLIVSAPRDDRQGVDSGAVYIFERNTEDSSQGWQQIALITAPDAEAGDRFGAGLFFAQGVLYIGAPQREQGKVYLYSRDTESGLWQVNTMMTPQDPQASGFGAGIGQDAQTLIIGAPYTDADNSKEAEAKVRQGRFAISKGDTFDPGIESGAIYTYQKNAEKWQFTARLGASNRESSDHLGEDIAIEGNIIVASIKHKDVFDDLRAGVVYIYKKVADNWEEDTALVASDPNVGANFGVTFSLLNKQILVGANKVHDNGFNSGQAYLFAQNAEKKWELIHQYANAGLNPHDQFGLGVALNSEYMLVASKDAVYAFQNTQVAYYPASFYPQLDTLQLNEIAVAGAGVYAATLALSQIENELFLSLTELHLRTDKAQSENRFSNDTALLTIPRLAIHSNTEQTQFYQLVLQKVNNSAAIQFRVVSAKPL